MIRVLESPIAPCLTLIIKPYSVPDTARWDAFVRRTSPATLCHLSGWQRVVERAWNHRQYSLCAERGAEIVGVLPLFHIRSRWFGSSLISSPNAVYGGAVASDAETHQTLIEAALTLAAELQVDYLELRDAVQNNPPTKATPHRPNLYVAFERTLPGDEDELMNSFPRDVRRMIRLGVKHGLSSESGREELLDEFYEVYAVSLRRLGTPVFPKRLFVEFLREFPDNSDILLIRQNRKIAAAVLSFYFRDTVMPYYAGAYEEFYRAGVNNFLYWELMRRSQQRGFTRFDFGRSKLGTGACEFKRGWRMIERPLPYQVFPVRAQEPPNLNPTNPKFKLMIEAWKHLPLGVTKMLGPKIVKYLL